VQESNGKEKDLERKLKEYDQNYIYTVDQKQKELDTSLAIIFSLSKEILIHHDSIYN